jgi:hypothetical protein
VETNPPSPNGIGGLNETSLHFDLKHWYSRPGDCLEVQVEGYVVDIVRGDLLIEIQTRNFAKLKDKLHRLADAHPVRLVHPIAAEKWITRLAEDGETRLSRRKSPKRGRLEHVFSELIRMPHLMSHPNFSLEVLLIREEEIQVEDGRGSWRRKGRSIADRRLLEVLSSQVFTMPEDFLILLPAELPEVFTTRDLARSSGHPRRIAQKMAYCLSRMGAIQPVGFEKQSKLYEITRKIISPQGYDSLGKNGAIL